MNSLVPPELLSAGPIRQLRIDLTEKCNLRCIYCAVSGKHYAGVDMPPEIARRTVDMIVQLARFHDLMPVDVNGHGETTFREDWVDLIGPLHEHGIPLRLQSNFAKHFSERELEALSCMHVIAVSIDTADRDMLRQIRRHVDIRQIISNIVFVRAAAIRMFRKPPEFVFVCGLYDKNALHIEGLARLAVALGIKTVSLWNLHRHPQPDGDGQEQVSPLDDLSDADLRPRVEAILQAIQFLRTRGVIVDIMADFVNILARRVGIDV